FRTGGHQRIEIHTRVFAASGRAVILAVGRQTPVSAAVIYKAHRVKRSRKEIAGRVLSVYRFTGNGAGVVGNYIPSKHALRKAVAKRILTRALNSWSETNHAIQIELYDIVAEYKVSCAGAITGDDVAGLLDGIVFHRDGISAVYLQEVSHVARINQIEKQIVRNANALSFLTLLLVISPKDFNTGGV